MNSPLCTDPEFKILYSLLFEKNDGDYGSISNKFYIFPLLACCLEGGNFDYKYI